MQIFIREKCSECDGVGVLTSAIWSKFFAAEEQYRKDHNEDMPEELMYEFFRDNGYTVYKNSDLPPEEPVCGSCEGSGLVERWVEAQELFVNVFPIISKHWQKEAAV